MFLWVLNSLKNSGRLLRFSIIVSNGMVDIGSHEIPPLLDLSLD